MLAKDEYWVDYDVKDRRKLLTPPEYYLDVNKLEKIYYENTDQIPLNLLSVLQDNVRKFFDIKWDLSHQFIGFMWRGGYFILQTLLICLNVTWQT